jgi:hypothetical protein
MVAGPISKAHPEAKVDLDNPDIAVIANVFKACGLVCFLCCYRSECSWQALSFIQKHAWICMQLRMCIGVAPDYRRLRRYNLHELVKQVENDEHDN